MALLAEELVEEWLNRKGYFTIRGAKLGVHEIDLLAVRWVGKAPECRHIEVQASVRPIGYICPVPKEVRKTTGRAAGSVKARCESDLKQGINEWIEKKFELPDKVGLKERLAPGPWSRELVIHLVRHEHEIELFREAGIKVLRLTDIVSELQLSSSVIGGASGSHLVDLVGITPSYDGGA